MFTLTFWKAAAERAIKTFAQVLAGFLTVHGLGVTSVDWQSSLSVSALAAIASVVTSVATAAATDGNPSLGSVEKLSPKG